MPRGRVFLVGIIVLVLGLILLALTADLESNLNSMFGRGQLSLPVYQRLEGLLVVIGLLALAFAISGFTVAAMAIASKNKLNGLPLTDINPGIYEIAFMKVFQAGDPNASVQVVIKETNPDPDFRPDFLFFKFPIQSFEGEIISDAKKLVVVVSGEENQFKKLYLKKE